MPPEWVIEMMACRSCGKVFPIRVPDIGEERLAHVVWLCARCKLYVHEFNDMCPERWDNGDGTGTCCRLSFNHSGECRPY